VTQTSIRLLGQYLTAENHEAILARASRRNRDAINALVAELRPQPDVRASVRKLPTFTATHASTATPRPVAISVPTEPPPAIVLPATALALTPRSVVWASAPQRYRAELTMVEETRDKVRRVQALLRREIPDGDLAVIFDQAISLPLDHLEKTRLGKADRPGHARLSVPKRIKKPGQALAPRAISRARSSVRSGSAMGHSAPSSLQTEGDARNKRSWSCTTSSPTRNRARPRSRTSPFGAGATTNTKPS
jgi:hypothetical protein